MPERIVIIGNKTWEVEPVTYALTSSFFSKVQLSPNEIHLPGQHRNGDLRPTMVWELSETLIIELWCLQKIMNVNSAPHEYEQHYSSSEEKFRHIPAILNYRQQKPSLIIAFASGSYPSEFSRNGSVMLGSRCFIHNARPDGSNPVSNWQHKAVHQVIESPIPDTFFDQLNLQLAKLQSREFFERRMLRPPVNPGHSVDIIASKEILALSNVNMISSADYGHQYRMGLQILRTSGLHQQLGVVDTTIGIIGLCAAAIPFFFISPITDRAGHYDLEVGPMDIAQNFSACFNGGIFISWLLPFLMKVHMQS